MPEWGLKHRRVTCTCWKHEWNSSRRRSFRAFTSVLLKFTVSTVCCSAHTPILLSSYFNSCVLLQMASSHFWGTRTERCTWEGHTICIFTNGIWVFFYKKRCMVAVVCVMNFQIVLCQSSKLPLIALDFRSLDVALPLSPRHNLTGLFWDSDDVIYWHTRSQHCESTWFKRPWSNVTGIDHHIENLIAVYRRESAYSLLCCSYEIHYLLSTCYRGSSKPWMC
jgi:hypothetical protein